MQFLGLLSLYTGLEVQDRAWLTDIFKVWANNFKCFNLCIIFSMSKNKYLVEIPQL